MKELGYGRDYKYPHEYEGHVLPGEDYLPQKLKNMIYYEPTESGYEKKIKERLERIKNYKKGGEKR